MTVSTRFTSLLPTDEVEADGDKAEEVRYAHTLMIREVMLFRRELYQRGVAKRTMEDVYDFFRCLKVPRFWSAARSGFPVLRGRSDTNLDPELNTEIFSLVHDNTESATVDTTNVETHPQDPNNVAAIKKTASLLLCIVLVKGRKYDDEVFGEVDKALEIIWKALGWNTGSQERSESATEVGSVKPESSPP